MSRLFRRAFFELAVPKTCRVYAGGKNSLKGYSISQIMGYLNGRSSLMTFDRHANLEYLSIGTGTFGPKDII